MSILRRFLILTVGTALGGYFSMRLQFGFEFSPKISEELILLGVVVAVSCLFVLFLHPARIYFERNMTPKLIPISLFVVSVVCSIVIGLWFYVGFLPRSFAHVMGRDLLYVLSFSLLGVGYVLSYYLQRRI